jgi:hypothetical protein
VTVVVEFTVPPDRFLLGGALPDSDVRIELERVVPTTGAVVPYVWASGSGVEAFADRASGLPTVTEFTLIDDADGQSLYRLDVDRRSPTVDALASSGGSLLLAEWHDGWSLRARFDERTAASAFMERCADRSVPITVERVYTADRPSRRGPVGLTDKQYEALELAVEAGYFTSPKRATLDELADVLEISPQALSKRLRRANELVLRSVLDAPDEGRTPFVRGGDRRAPEGDDPDGREPTDQQRWQGEGDGEGPATADPGWLPPVDEDAPEPEAEPDANG